MTNRATIISELKKRAKANGGTLTFTPDLSALVLEHCGYQNNRTIRAAVVKQYTELMKLKSFAVIPSTRI